MRIALWLLALLSLGGCAHYEFQLTEPPELAARAGRGDKGTVLVARPPLEYRLRSVEGRLVILVTNTTDQPIELIGQESYVVSPDGQSRPLPNQSIAPHAFIKLILPPLRSMYRLYPSWGIGIGVSAWNPYPYPYYTGGFYGPGYPYYYSPYYYDQPYYLVSYDDADPNYWDWQGESSIRMRLTWRHAARTFNHDFVFRRVKV